MSNETSNTNPSWASKLTKGCSSQYGGKSVPVQFILECETEQLANVYTSLHWDDPLLDQIREQNPYGSVAMGCQSTHRRGTATATCLMRLPPPGALDQLPLMEREVIRIFNDRESDLDQVIHFSNFADHKLVGLSLAVVWHMPGMPPTSFRGALFVDVESLGQDYKEVPGILIRSFNGLNAADTMKPGELNGDSESKTAEGGELDELPQQELKWRLEFEKALDALSERDWQGHLVAVCTMQGIPSNLDTTPAGSDVAEESDIPEKHEATEEHKTEGGLEFPD